ncbi:kelch repeat protein [Coleophoma cylindrospora]|uniref:Kelch repeat protein n=1 Tax=Coleophoma cylindrospora TaxID=1849047 RepID=A0A3D8Q8X5_9HELO|nr:kelch repeat protein [Coleophoma cylindrospora]
MRFIQYLQEAFILCNAGPPMLRMPLRFVLVIIALCVITANAQQSGWQANQINATLCQWQSPRAAVVRDALYIDGGYLWWVPGLADGTYGPPTADDNPLGLVYILNFSTQYDTSQNISLAFSTLSKASNGGAANNIGPQYIDGAMFANDYEWWTYGGLLQLTDAYDAPASDSVAAYQVYSSPNAKQFQQGFVLKRLPSGISRYITDGASVSVPSENLGFYFSGLQAENFGPIYYLPGTQNSSENADVESETLIQLNMTSQQQEVWSNFTLPSSVPPRANAEIVWVPVSEQGILVAVGGVINPSYANINQTNNAANAAASQRISPTFMSTVSVYDIAKQTWYEQPTSGGGPGALTQGCTVLASAQDGSSHNIYWYGGFNGLDATSEFSDDVWILSIPSFMWMKVYSGSKTHGRAGHRCAKPYPDQMIVVGGYPSLAGRKLNCVEGFIQVFNLSNSEWIDAYNPAVWSNYTVPSMISAMIGGSGTGNATQTAPTPTGFSNPDLSTIFAAPYATSKISTWYPYKSAQTGFRNGARSPHSSRTPRYLAPLLGVLLGLFLISVIIFTAIFLRRRVRRRGQAAKSDTVGNEQQRRVMSWVRATSVHGKSPTIPTDVAPPYSQHEGPPTPEVGGTAVHEMMDTSKPVELETGFSFLRVPPNRTGLGMPDGLRSSPSNSSNISQFPRPSPNNQPSISAASSASPTHEFSTPTSTASASTPPRPSRSPSRTSDVSSKDKPAAARESDPMPPQGTNGQSPMMVRTRTAPLPYDLRHGSKRRQGTIIPDMNLSAAVAEDTGAGSQARRSGFAEDL